MEAFKKRLLDESLQLHIRIEHLSKVINDEKKFAKIDTVMQVLMVNQLTFMQGYCQNLDARIGIIVSGKEMEEYKNSKTENAEHKG